MGLWTVIALLTAGAQPTLPSSHAVLVSIRPAGDHQAKGGGHLVWYRRGGLLVVDIGVAHLPPHATVSALLVPQGTCTGPTPKGTRVVGKVRANGHGLAQFNAEMLGVFNLRFSAFALWIEAAGHGRSPTACGVVSLSNGTLITS